MKAESKPEAPSNYIEFLELEDLIELIEGPNGEACRQMYHDFHDLINTAPGASKNHHTWRGGYRDHVAQVMNLFRQWYAEATNYGWIRQLPATEQFTLSDGLTVLWLHDLEKPFKYNLNSDGSLEDNPDLASKALRKAFRQSLIERYDIVLRAEPQNALLHVEGVRDEYYSPNERVDHPLAAMCHSCDLISARVLYNVRGNGGPLTEVRP